MLRAPGGYGAPDAAARSGSLTNSHRLDVADASVGTVREHALDHAAPHPDRAVLAVEGADVLRIWLSDRTVYGARNSPTPQFAADPSYRRGLPQRNTSG